MGVFVILRSGAGFVKREFFHMALVLRDIHLYLFPIRAILIFTFRDFAIEAFIPIRRETALGSFLRI